MLRLSPSLLPLSTHVERGPGGAALVLLSLLLAACAGSSSTPTSTTMTASSSAPAGSASAIVQAGASVLRTPAAPVAPERIATPEIQQLVTTMIAAMRQAPGVGLAAPQLGVPLRILVLEDTPERMGALTPDEVRERERVVVPVRVFINPVLRPIGDDRRVFFEGCLSVKGLTALVERYAEVEVTGLDEHGQPQTMHVRGWPARILQHEVDHLDGTLYVDRMMSRSLSTIEHARARFSGKPIAEVRRLLGL